MNFKFVVTEVFSRQVKKLAKRYPKIKIDLSNFKQDFNEGRVKGRAIPGLKHKVYKARMKSTDMQRGKRGGYRVIYYLQTIQNRVILLTIYAKARRENIRVQEILSLLKKFGIEI